MPSALITGVSSFSGLHLARYLESLGFGPIFGCDISDPSQKTPLARRFICDIGEATDVAAVFNSVTPDLVFHLAGSSDETDPEDLIRTNIAGAWNLLNTCRRQPVRPSGILLVGSAAGYGPQSADVDSLSEDMPAHPVTFYGLSREAELTLGRIAFEKWGLPVFLCRTFNLVGPGLSDRYAPAAIWRRLMEFKGAGEARFPLQNAGATRDFVDVRDAVRAYVSIVKRGRPGITYNVGSGKGVSIEEIALQLFALAGVPVSAMTYGAPDHTGRSDSNRSIANIKRITNETGWQPEVTLEQSLSDMHREATKASADNSAHSPSDAQDESVAPLRSE